jgi:hypothetical protein
VADGAAAPPSGLVYRDSVAEVTEAQLVDDLLAQLRAVDPTSSPTAQLGAFLSAAALECALADADSPRVGDAAGITDRTARAFLAPAEAGDLGDLARQLAPWRTSRVLRVSRPEGFAYYALWPRPFAAAACAALADRDVLVIGIRTIGTALAAVAAAALARDGRHVERCTVRPTGHPFDRRLAPSPGERAAILRARDRGAAALVVDEGPGLSGSSFLAVAEQLAELRFPRSRIHLLGTRAVDPARLVAPDAARRWSAFAAHVAEAPSPWHRSDELDLSGGAWRAHLFPGVGAAASPDVDAGPPVWPAQERRKALSGPPGDQILRKFAGLPPYGDAVHARAQLLAGTGFCPPLGGSLDGDGFLPHRFIVGQPLARRQLGPALALHIGRYIAQRAALLPAPELTAAQRAAFEHMIVTNVGLELGRPFGLPAPPQFARMVVPDAHLAPHEWVRDPTGRVWKTDAVDHGDDHFFPGPTDVAWDLAGAIVEWDLSPGARTRVIAAYQAASGDDPRPRLAPFLIGYAAFRARFCLMAAASCDSAQAGVWRRAHRGYARTLRRALRELPAARAGVPLPELR